MTLFPTVQVVVTAAPGSDLSAFPKRSWAQGSFFFFPALSSLTLAMKTSRQHNKKAVWAPSSCRRENFLSFFRISPGLNQWPLIICPHLICILSFWGTDLVSFVSFKFPAWLSWFDSGQFIVWPFPSRLLYACNAKHSSICRINCSTYCLFFVFFHYCSFKCQLTYHLCDTFPTSSLSAPMFVSWNTRNCGSLNCSPYNVNILPS